MAREQADLVDGIVITWREWILSENAVRLAAHIIPITMYTHIHSLILGDSNSTSRSVEYDDSGESNM